MLKFKKLTLAVGVLLLAVACQKDPLNQLDIPNSEEAKLEAALESPYRGCGMEEHMQELLLNPDYAEFHQRKFVKLSTAVTNGRASVVIPVAVHYQRLNGNIDVQCLRDLAQSQIDILNADYSGTNADITNWTNGASSAFPGVNYGQASIEFKLANINHPGGYGLVDGDPAVTINQSRRDSDRNWSGYLNIFVRNIQYLGYSPLGGRGNGDGVVIDDQAFGAGSGCGSVAPGAPYNLGRTLTHELGHYLLLDHIWGGGCNSDDGVGDTPDSSGPYYSGETTFCPEVGVQSCGTNDMHMNYMDYVYDACMYMFSAGQATRMENYVSSSLSALASNASNVIDGGDPPPPPSGDCVVPTGLASSVNKKKVNLSWDAQAGTTFEVRYSDDGGNSWTTVSASSNSATLNGMRNGSYIFQVRAICGTTTAWSSSGSFTV